MQELETRRRILLFSSFAKGQHIISQSSMLSSIKTREEMVRDLVERKEKNYIGACLLFVVKEGVFFQKISEISHSSLFNFYLFIKYISTGSQFTSVI